MKGKAIFIGRVSQAIDLKYTAKDQKAFCRFDVAESVLGEEKPIWHKVVVWGKQAESCRALLDKGKEVFVQGRKVPKEYRKDSGEVKKYEEIHADKIGFINI